MWAVAALELDDRRCRFVFGLSLKGTKAIKLVLLAIDVVTIEVGPKLRGPFLMDD